MIDMRRFDGEPREVRIAYAREVSRRNARAAVRGPHSQVLAIQRLDDFRREDRLGLFSIRVLGPEIAETFPLPRATSSFSLFIATAPSISSSGPLSGRSHVSAF
jgi:hypothetical protein